MINNYNVFVYRNLRKNCYSIRNRKSGRVQDHADQVLLFNAKFNVQEGGRQRVLREKRKNVHAGIKGFLMGMANAETKITIQPGMKKVSYNPYKAGHFFEVETGKPIYEAEIVMLTTEGVYAK